MARPRGAGAGDEGNGAGERAVVDPPRDHEHRLDVEDDEEHGDEVELDREAVTGVAEGDHAGLVRLDLHRRGLRAHGEVGDAEDQHRVDEDESEEEEDRQVRAEHRVGVGA
jgi:hypothetical protein